MPRVEPERTARGWRRFTLTGMTALVVLGSIAGYIGYNLVRPAKALASTQLPNNSDRPLYLIVSQSSGAANINAPDDYMKVYFDTSTPSPAIEIFNSQFDPC